MVDSCSWRKIVQSISTRNWWLAAFSTRQLSTLWYDQKTIFYFSGSVSCMKTTAGALLLAAVERLIAVNANAFLANNEKSHIVISSPIRLKLHTDVKVAIEPMIEIGLLWHWNAYSSSTWHPTPSEWQKSSLCRHSSFNGLQAGSYGTCCHKYSVFEMFALSAKSVLVRRAEVFQGRPQVFDCPDWSWRSRQCPN